MRLDELLKFSGLFFEREGVEYFLFGATAMNFWIPPRNTVDLDVVLCAEQRKARTLLKKLARQGFPVPRDLLRKFLEGRLIKIPLGESELDLKLGRTPHEQETLRRAKFFEADDFRLRIALPEDLILFKLQSWRRQDQADVERMLRQRTDLDRIYIESWLEDLEQQTGFPMRERWDEIRR